MGRRLPWLHPELRVPYSVSGSTANERTQSTRDSSHRATTFANSKPSEESPTLTMRSAARASGRGRLIQDLRTPSRARQEAPASTPGSSSKRRLDGLYSFSNGTFYCNCVPRLEAKLLTAGKDTKNPGRKFYACTLRKCRFFLWEDQAVARSGGVMPSSSARHNAPAEAPTPTPGPEKRGKAPPSATQMPTPSTRASSSKKTRTQPIQHYFSTAPRPDGKTAGPSSSSEAEAHATGEPEESFQRSGASTATLAASTPSAGGKRKRVSFEEEDYDVSSDEERRMSVAMELSSRKLQATAPTPQTETSTPATQRAADTTDAGALPTARKLFIEERPQRSAPAAQQQSPANQVNITEEVMDLLPRELDASVADAVRQALGRHASRLRGAILGRDAVRTQLRAKDERIATLQERVTSLENKTKMQREEITNIKAGLANLYSQH